LGLIPDGTPGTGGTLAYWGVPDAAALDAFGNAFGIIENLDFDLKTVR
jgi:hypothetical protein